MNQDLKIKIKVDSNTKEVSLLSSEVNKLGKSFNDADTFANTLAKRLNFAGHAYIAFQALNRTLGDMIKTGVEYNKSLQNLTNGLTTLEVATSENITTTGRLVSLQEKHALASKEATRAIQELTKANAETPHKIETLTILTSYTVQKNLIFKFRVLFMVLFL